MESNLHRTLVDRMEDAVTSMFCIFEWNWDVKKYWYGLSCYNSMFSNPPYSILTIGSFQRSHM